MSAPARGKAGSESSLPSGHQVVMGAEIAGLIEINPHRELPVSGAVASKFPGNTAAREIPREVGNWPENSGAGAGFPSFLPFWILAYFSRSDSGLEMTPKSSHP